MSHGGWAEGQGHGAMGPGGQGAPSRAVRARAMRPPKPGGMEP